MLLQSWDMCVSMQRRATAKQAASRGTVTMHSQNMHAAKRRAPSAFALSTVSRRHLCNKLSAQPVAASTLILDREAVQAPVDSKARRQSLQGAVIVFVAAYYSGKRFIFERAKELGVRAIVIDGPESWVKSLEAEGIIEKFVPLDLDFSDIEGAFEETMEAVQAIKAELGQLDGVTTFCEYAVPLAARIAKQMGAAYNPPSSVDNARDKFKMREVMEKAGLPGCKHFLIKEESDLEEAGRHVGFPAVVKPVAGLNSLGCVRCNSQAELEQAYQSVLTELSKVQLHSVDGCFVVDDDLVCGVSGEKYLGLDLMLEEYLDGPEVDVDLVFSEGRCVYGAITDNWPTEEPYFKETVSCAPSQLPEEHQKEMMDLAVTSVQALGFKLGVFHVEGRYTSRGARLLEINCRMGGGGVRDFNLLVWGVDLIEEHLKTSAGIPTQPPTAPKPLTCVAENDITPKNTGVLQNVDWATPWLDHPDVHFFRLNVQPGDKVISANDGLPTWLCEVMVTRPTVKEALDLVHHIEDSMDIAVL